MARYRATTPGTPDRKSRSFRLAWEGLCPTIRAGTGMDKGAFQAVRPIHPDGERVITVREAARISGFPDCHLFANSIWQSFRMLGNAIPVPAVARAALRRRVQHRRGLMRHHYGRAAGAHQ